MVFSVREAEQLYERAVADAWSEVEKRLREVAAETPGQSWELVEVSYDRSPFESIIEELPDRPKSSRPQAVEVSVKLQAKYRRH